MERYQQGRIYAIRSNETAEVYIGSTCLTLPKRIWKHRAAFNQYKKGKKENYITSFKMIEYADHYIELIEMYPCNSKAELERREGEIMREHANRVNKVLAGRTAAEWRDDNKDEIRQKAKEFRDAADKEDKIRYMRAWHEAHREEVKIKNKKWNEAHKDKAREYNKARWQEEKKKPIQKIICECGSTHTKSHTVDHQRTLKHKAYIAAL